MPELTDGEREALLTPCGCGHSINDHGSACWLCGDEGRECAVTFEALLCERVAEIVAGQVKTRLAAVEALADEWEAAGVTSVYESAAELAQMLRDALAAGVDGGGCEGGGDA